LTKHILTDKRSILLHYKKATRTHSGNTASIRQRWLWNSLSALKTNHCYTVIRSSKINMLLAITTQK